MSSLKKIGMQTSSSKTDLHSLLSALNLTQSMSSNTPSNGLHTILNLGGNISSILGTGSPNYQQYSNARVPPVPLPTPTPSNQSNQACPLVSFISENLLTETILSTFQQFPSFNGIQEFNSIIAQIQDDVNNGTMNIFTFASYLADLIIIAVKNNLLNLNLPTNVQLAALDVAYALKKLSNNKDIKTALDLLSATQKLIVAVLTDIDTSTIQAALEAYPKLKVLLGAIKSIIPSGSPVSDILNLL